jgi:hypothetical protein
VNIALKEWAVVIEALAEGSQTFLLRKGGIAEGKRGFELLHRRFLLFPTWEHQHREALQPAWRDRFDAIEPPDASVIELRYFAEAHDIVPAPPDPAAFLRLPEAHIWTGPFFEKRYEYRPDLPLYVVAVRVFELPAPVRIESDRRYQGCRSWVELYQDVGPAEAARPVLSESAFMQAWQAFHGVLQNGFT